MEKKVGLLIKLEALPGKEKDVAALLRTCLPLAQEEPDTLTWYAVQFSPTSFGIFDTFPHDEGRKRHLASKVGQVLLVNTQRLLAKDPEIIFTDILAVKDESE